MLISAPDYLKSEQGQWRGDYLKLHKLLKKQTFEKVFKIVG